MKPAAALGSPEGGSHPPPVMGGPVMPRWLTRMCGTPKEAPVGDWYEQPDGTWRYDRAAPTPGPVPEVTSMLPVVAADEPEVERIRPRNDLDAAGEPLR